MSPKINYLEYFFVNCYLALTYLSQKVLAIVFQLL